MLRLSKGVHAAAVGNDLVFLDERADRYLCVVDAASQGLLDRQAGADPKALAALSQAGLIDSGAPLRPLTIEWALPTRNLPDDARSERMQELGDVGWCLWDAQRMYRGRSFEAILQVGRRRATGLLACERDAAAIAMSFRSWAAFAPGATKCLLRAFMLLRLLRREGLDASWVFAVRTWPFAAHCWLQLGELALDGEAERLAAYVPILVI